MSRGAWSKVCPHCGQLYYKSTTELAVEWLQQHPDDSLTTSDVCLRFSVGRITAYHAMSKAHRKGQVERAKVPGRNEWEWSIKTPL